MKRRNAEFGKLRRPIKRNKIAEGINTFLYAKYFLLWGAVVTADFMLDFRFELLWPFWLLLRSVFDSYKYKGLTFTILFVCIAITSDLMCMFFIPINWLFFLASTYVWVQYVWHAVDKGACLPTIFLWTIFLYLEGAIRWRDSKSVPHIDLCRPFAAHCIGYPVVTLGFGIKSYIGYRIRHRKQREVAKENEFFVQLLHLALPNENPIEDELIAQMQQTFEILHSEKFGEIDLPITSTLITQRIQQQRLLLVSNLLNGSAKVSSIVTNDENSSHKLVNNHQMNGFSSQVALTSRIAQCSTIPIATVPASTGLAMNPITTAPQATNLNHSNNNNISNSNLNIAASQNGFNGNHHHHHHQTQNHQMHHLNSPSIPTYRNNRRSMDRSDNKVIDKDILASSEQNTWNSMGSQTDSLNNANTIVHDGSSVSRLFSYICSIVYSVHGTMKRCYQSVASNFIRKVTESFISKMKSIMRHKQYVTDGIQNASNRCDTGNGINATQISRTERLKSGSSHNGRSSETNGLLNTAIVAPMASRATSTDTDSISGQIVQTRYSNHFQPQINDSEKLLCKQNIECDTQFNHLESNCNNGIERSRGRRNRGKQKDITHHHTHTCKDNHNNSNAIRNSSPLSQQSERCESCIRLEIEIKRQRNEINHLRHIEHELRHKSDQNAATKSCLQAKQRENEELEKKLQELVIARQQDKQNAQQAERRLTEERRQKQSFESQLNNERKQRKLTEEKLSRADCSENCRLRKQTLQNECRQLRKELTMIEELKKSAEKQSRNYEQELRKFEAELRSREPRESTEVLMSALQAMQEKNKTLEKSLSAETRVKLDLFSALGEAKRQLEIRDNIIRQKDKEVVDLKAKIAQFYAVMPTVQNEAYLPKRASCNNTPLLRMSDTGPSSPLSHAADTIYTPDKKKMI